MASTAEPTACDIAVVGAGKQGDTWVVAAGDEILVKVIARDRFGNRTHWAEGQAVAVEVRRCKLDPSLKATCFQTLNLRVHTVLST